MQQHAEKLDALPTNMTSNPGILIELGWWDTHLLQCDVTCSNGAFSGRTRVYLGHSRLAEMAGVLNAFPTHVSDVRDFELATSDPQTPAGGVLLHFYCLDSSGHIAVNVQLRGDTCAGMGQLESVALKIPLEAAAIDKFVEQLRNFRNEGGGVAHLPMAI